METMQVIEQIENSELIAQVTPIAKKLSYRFHAIGSRNMAEYFHHDPCALFTTLLDNLQFSAKCTKDAENRIIWFDFNSSFLSVTFCVDSEGIEVSRYMRVDSY